MSISRGTLGQCLAVHHDNRESHRLLLVLKKEKKISYCLGEGKAELGLSWIAPVLISHSVGRLKGGIAAQESQLRRHK